MIGAPSPPFPGSGRRTPPAGTFGYFFSWVAWDTAASPLPPSCCHRGRGWFRWLQRSSSPSRRSCCPAPPGQRPLLSVAQCGSHLSQEASCSPPRKLGTSSCRKDPFFSLCQGRAQNSQGYVRQNVHRQERPDQGGQRRFNGFQPGGRRARCACAATGRKSTTEAKRGSQAGTSLRRPLPCPAPLGLPCGISRVFWPVSSLSAKPSVACCICRRRC